MFTRRVASMIVATVVPVVVCGAASAQPQHLGASRSNGDVLRVMHAPIHWMASLARHPKPGLNEVIRTTKGIALFGRHSVMVLKSSKTIGHKTTTEVSVGLQATTSSSPGVYTEPDYDSIYNSDGTTVTETDYTSGTLAYDDGSGNFQIPSPPDIQPDDPCPGDVFCSGLTYKYTDCIQTAPSSGAHAYACYHVYAAANSGKYGYRVGWWTSTVNAEPGFSLNQEVARNGMAGCSACGVQEDAWSPASTRNISKGSETTTLGFNFQIVNGSIGQTLQIYSQSYGPSPNYPTTTQFQFQWGGNMPYPTAIGLDGGEQWQFLLSHGYPLYSFFDNYIT